MDLFELLFIAIFIVVPLLEGLLRKRGKGEGGGPPVESGEEQSPWSSEPDAEPRSAADMVPDDLWEIMTGEKRAPEPVESGGEPWSTAPGTATAEPAGAEAPGSDVGFDTDTELEWDPEPWMVDDEVEARPAESLEYRGPEAYSLETPASPPIERTVPSAEVRHRRFHELVDEPPPAPPRAKSPLMKALSSNEGLRQAVLLKEILGPPKGLE